MNLVGLITQSFSVNCKYLHFFLLFALTKIVVLILSAKNPAAGTIFKFTGNTSTHSKKTFDLKASLSKPLGYKPHTGKLKPVDTNKPESILKPMSKLSKPVQGSSRQAMASKTRPTQPK